MNSVATTHRFHREPEESQDIAIIGTPAVVLYVAETLCLTLAAYGLGKRNRINHRSRVRRPGLVPKSPRMQPVACVPAAIVIGQ